VDSFRGLCLTLRFIRNAFAGHKHSEVLDGGAAEGLESWYRCVGFLLAQNYNTPFSGGEAKNASFARPLLFINNYVSTLYS
jgi:hypothetical protein